MNGIQCSGTEFMARYARAAAGAGTVGGVRSRSRWASSSAKISVPRRAGHIATVTRDPDWMDLCAVGEDGRVYVAWWHGSWNDWQPIGSIG
ncbi:hypothetical protein [Streptomyces sp. NPDC001410]|uniref:hypothetical protein n=1 Tax=Streptomyces sp. NPDC001410 TaxID=3364574 RepID=UPI0036889B23